MLLAVSAECSLLPPIAACESAVEHDPQSTVVKYGPSASLAVMLPTLQ